MGFSVDGQDSGFRATRWRNADSCWLANRVSILVACSIPTCGLLPFAADAQTVYFVPNDFPDSGQIQIVEDGPDERFCVLGLEGLDIARSRFGLTPCQVEFPRDYSDFEQDLVRHNIDVLLLVDDRTQLSPRLTQLLSGAIQQHLGTQYYVFPTGMEFTSARQAAAGNTGFSSVYRAMVIGERVYQDHYTNFTTGEIVWKGTIDSQIRSTALPGNTVPTIELDTDQAAREYYEAGKRAYENGDFEEAYRIFLRLSQLPGLDRPLLAFNVIMALGALGSESYLQGRNQAAVDSWRNMELRIAAFPTSIRDLLPDENRNQLTVIEIRQPYWSANALTQLGNGALARQIYSDEVVEAAPQLDMRTELTESFITLNRIHGQ